VICETRLRMATVEDKLNVARSSTTNRVNGREVSGKVHMCSIREFN